MTSVILLSRVDSSFVRRDLAILQAHFETSYVPWTYPGGPMKLARLASTDTVVVSWFAGAHAATAAISRKILGTRTIVQLGGYDCTALRDIEYGAFLDPLRSMLVGTAVRWSDAVVAVDQSLVFELSRHYPISRRVDVLPTGYDSAFWAATESKQDLVLTVGTIDRSNAVRKGFYTFARAAATLTKARFVLVGRAADTAVVSDLRKLSRDRLEIPGAVSDISLRAYYRNARVYCQLSRFEGLPNALCEAMLCECVPVGTEVGGIPTAIGNTGEYCRYGDAADSVAAIERALGRNGYGARARIMNDFPVERREKGLVDLVLGLTDESRNRPA